MVFIENEIDINMSITHSNDTINSYLEIDNSTFIKNDGSRVFAFEYSEEPDLLVTNSIFYGSSSNNPIQPSLSFLYFCLTYGDNDFHNYMDENLNLIDFNPLFCNPDSGDIL